MEGGPLYAVAQAPARRRGARRGGRLGRIHAALDVGDPNGEVRETWVAKERVRDVYGTDDPEQAAARLDAAIAWCTEAERRRSCAAGQDVAAVDDADPHPPRTGASNGPVEAMNLLIKHVKRSGRGIRSFANYRLRILLAGGRRQREAHPVTSIRTRRPRLVA